MQRRRFAVRASFALTSAPSMSIVQFSQPPPRVSAPPNAKASSDVDGRRFDIDLRLRVARTPSMPSQPRAASQPRTARHAKAYCRSRPFAFDGFRAFVNQHFRNLARRVEPPRLTQRRPAPSSAPLRIAPPRLWLIGGSFCNLRRIFPYAAKCKGVSTVSLLFALTSAPLSISSFAASAAFIRRRRMQKRNISRAYFSH